MKKATSKDAAFIYGMNHKYTFIHFRCVIYYYHYRPRSAVIAHVGHTLYEWIYTPLKKFARGRHRKQMPPAYVLSVYNPSKSFLENAAVVVTPPVGDRRVLIARSPRIYRSIENCSAPPLLVENLPIFIA